MPCCFLPRRHRLFLLAFAAMACSLVAGSALAQDTGTTNTADPQGFCCISHGEACKAMDLTTCQNSEHRQGGGFFDTAESRCNVGCGYVAAPAPTQCFSCESRCLGGDCSQNTCLQSNPQYPDVQCQFVPRKTDQQGNEISPAQCVTASPSACTCSACAGFTTDCTAHPNCTIGANGQCQAKSDLCPSTEAACPADTCETVYADAIKQGYANVGATCADVQSQMDIQDPNVQCSFDPKSSACITVQPTGCSCDDCKNYTTPQQCKAHAPNCTVSGSQCVGADVCISAPEAVCPTDSCESAYADAVINNGDSPGEATCATVTGQLQTEVDKGIECAYNQKTRGCDTAQPSNCTCSASLCGSYKSQIQCLAHGPNCVYENDTCQPNQEICLTAAPATTCPAESCELLFKQALGEGAPDSEATCVEGDNASQSCSYQVNAASHKGECTTAQPSDCTCAVCSTLKTQAACEAHSPNCQFSNGICSPYGYICPYTACPADSCESAYADAVFNGGDLADQTTCAIVTSQLQAQVDPNIECTYNAKTLTCDTVQPSECACNTCNSYATQTECEDHAPNCKYQNGSCMANTNVCLSPPATTCPAVSCESGFFNAVTEGAISNEQTCKQVQNGNPGITCSFDANAKACVTTSPNDCTCGICQKYDDNPQQCKAHAPNCVYDDFSGFCDSSDVCPRTTCPAVSCESGFIDLVDALAPPDALTCSEVEQDHPELKCSFDPNGNVCSTQIPSTCTCNVCQNYNGNEEQCNAHKPDCTFNVEAQQCEPTVGTCPWTTGSVCPAETCEKAFHDAVLDPNNPQPADAQTCAEAGNSKLSCQFVAFTKSCVTASPAGCACNVCQLYDNNPQACQAHAPNCQYTQVDVSDGVCEGNPQFCPASRCPATTCESGYINLLKTGQYNADAQACADVEALNKGLTCIFNNDTGACETAEPNGCDCNACTAYDQNKDACDAHKPDCLYNAATGQCDADQTVCPASYAFGCCLPDGTTLYAPPDTTSVYQCLNADDVQQGCTTINSQLACEANPACAWTGACNPKEVAIDRFHAPLSQSDVQSFNNFCQSKKEEEPTYTSTTVNEPTDLCCSLVVDSENPYQCVNETSSICVGIPGTSFFASQWTAETCQPVCKQIQVDGYSCQNTRGSNGAYICAPEDAFIAAEDGLPNFSADPASVQACERDCNTQHHLEYYPP